MSTISFSQGSRTSLLSLGTLASATYSASNAYNADTNKPQDVIIEAEATSGTVTGNKQLLLFVQASLDGTNFQTGPTSGTGSTDEPVLNFLGVLPLPSNATLQRRMFSLVQALGFIPRYFKIVVKNDSGVALASGNIYTAEISAEVS